MDKARTTRVLIVEDEFLVSEMIQEVLERGGYAVVGRAVDGPEAVEMTQTLRPDVVLMDLELPGDLDGIEATQRIQATCSTPVVALTAYETPELIERASAAGIGAYLTKPPNLREMERAITISIARFSDLLQLRRLNAELQAEIAEHQRAEEQIKRLNQDLERRARGLAALNKAGQIMASTLDLNTLLGLVMEQIRSLLNAEAASVLLCTPASDEGGDELVFAAATGSGSEQLVGTRLPITAGIVGWVVQEKRPVLVADAQNDPRFYNRIDVITGQTTHSLLAVPLISKGAVLGVVEAVNKGSGAFDQHDLEALEALANSGAIAIENARLYATEQQRAAALTRALEQQRELDRLQREFIQNVSHELRTPLALILGHAEVLGNGWMGELQPDQRASVDVIMRRSQMLSKLVDDIIGVLEVESQVLKREPVDLAQLVHTTLIKFQVTAEKADLVLSAEIAPGLPPVSGDSMALHRMLDNLLSNACKFTPAGGRVTVRLQPGEENVMLQVTDTGIGIPSDQVGRIFERFYQVDGSATRHYGGVGLGLALAKGIVEAHGGQITVTSQTGVGTTFTVLLPTA